MIVDPSYAMELADELNIVLRYDHLPLGEVLGAISARSAMTHVIVTGRNAPADMTMVKHPFRDQNIKA